MGKEIASGATVEREKWAERLLTATVALGAFLLFSIQPLIAKYILPWFGGTAVVWTTAMIFFQVMLIGGYGYAHWLVSKGAWKRGRWIHLIALGTAVMTLPVIPSETWKPEGLESPVVRIGLLLGASIGLVYVMLAATSPLIQRWFASTFPGRNPYKLFAVSNLASMSALLSYPLLIEPLLTKKEQAIGWSMGFVVYAVLCGYACIKFGGEDRKTGEGIARRNKETERPRVTQILVWTAMAALGSAMMMATSNHLTQNIPSIPLMWVLPLSVYLMTFVLCFDERGWYRPAIVLGELSLLIGAMSMLLANKGWQFMLLWNMVVFLIGLFVTCMFLHGELATRKPGSRQLTWFYMCVASGGAVGGFAVGVIAPITLPGVMEMEICVALIAICALVVTRKSMKGRRAGLVMAAAFCAVITTVSAGRFGDGALMMSRNFYGSLKVVRVSDSQGNAKKQLVHGAIVHGEQNEGRETRLEPTAYFTRTSGVGQMMDERAETASRVGIIGLGAGTLAAYARKGDVFRFYEIDPGVVKAARTKFTFLSESAGTIEIAIGDGRLAIEREVRLGNESPLDIVVVDAFSGDSIPVHLITSEAVDAYASRTKPNGVIAFHVSNKFINLVPVLERIAQEKKMRLKHVEEKSAEGRTISEWVVLTKDTSNMEGVGGTTGERKKNRVVWSDDYSNIIAALRF